MLRRPIRIMTKATTDPFAALRALRETMADVPEDNVAAEDDVPAGRPSVNVTIHYERKHRGGKEATILSGFDEWPEEDVRALAARLKQRLGTGGSARGGEILLQGDRRDILRHILPEFGIKVR